MHRSGSDWQVHRVPWATPLQKSRKCQRQYEALSTGAELTFDQILRDIEILQTGKVAELLRKATYRKNGNHQHKTTRSDRMLSGLPSRPMKDNCNLLRLVKATTSVVIVPRNLLPLRESSSRFARGASSFSVSGSGGPTQPHIFSRKQ